MQKTLIKLAKASLILVYLVIIAGAVVRMTGSGMGCPDWPKCFGYYIPPTSAETLQWQPKKQFKKGQVIIVDESLLVAKLDFTTPNNLNPDNWEPYTRHDYAIFNVWHTWIEYINRLLGALAGLATLGLALFSLRYWNKSRILTIMSWLVVFGMGFQAWLGATVVYSVLEPIKITLHMLMALAIVAMLFYIIKLLKVHVNKKVPKSIGILVAIGLGLTILQIILGTQVRQFIDDQTQLLGIGSKHLWLKDPTLQFYVHRSLSILVLLLNTYLFLALRKKGIPFTAMNYVVLFILLEIATGIAMYYADFPFASQPLHLVLASLLFGAQFYLLLQVLGKDKSHNSL